MLLEAASNCASLTKIFITLNRSKFKLCMQTAHINQDTHILHNEFNALLNRIVSI